MPASPSLRFLFVINPGAGSVGQTDWATVIGDYFARLPHVAELLTLNGPRDGLALRARIAAGRPDRLVAVGGVGRAVDVLYLNGTDLCLHLSDIGLNAQLVRHAQLRGWHGLLGYARAACWALWRRRLLRVRLRGPGWQAERTAFMVVLANARMYGTGALINPDGDVADGQFEVVVLRRLAARELLKLFWRFEPFDPAAIEIFPTTAVYLETQRPVDLQIDGECRGKITRLHAEIRPGALRLLVPAGAGPPAR